MPSQFVTDKHAFFRTANGLGLSDIENTHVPFDYTSCNRQRLEHECDELYASLTHNGESNRNFWLFCYNTSFMLKTHYERYNPQKTATYVDIMTEAASHLEYGLLNLDLAVDEPTISNIMPLLDNFRGRHIIIKTNTGLYQVNKKNNTFKPLKINDPDRQTLDAVLANQAPETLNIADEPTRDLIASLNLDLDENPNQTLLEKLYSDFDALSKIPFSASKLRNLSGNANMQRLSTRFTMLTVKQSLLLANQFHLLENLKKLLGLQINITILDAPLGIYNALSVGLFAARFMVDVIVIAKHWVMPLPEEANLPWHQRLYVVEFKNRHITMVNDAVWATVNALSNYNAYFHISAPVANYLMIGFSIFDLVWLNYVLYLTNRDYELQRADYLNYQSSLDTNSPEWRITQGQLEQLELNYEKNRSAIFFYIAAACLMIGAFAVAFLLAPEALVPLCFFACNIAIAMYLSGSEYGDYKQKQLYLSKHVNDTRTEQAHEQVHDTWNNLVYTLTKNTIAPFIIISAVTVSVPLAIGLTLTYMASEYGYLSRLADAFYERTAPILAP